MHNVAAFLKKFSNLYNIELKFEEETKIKILHSNLFRDDAYVKVLCAP